LKRARKLAKQGVELFATPSLRFFLYERITGADFNTDATILEKFCLLDDSDIAASMKVWASHSDGILSQLCTMLENRRLYKVKLSTQPLEHEYQKMKQVVLNAGKIKEEDLQYYLFSGSTSNSTYNQNDERIDILMKNGDVINVSKVDNALIGKDLTVPVEKFYICRVP
jgi:hypothetical protein